MSVTTIPKSMIILSVLFVVGLVTVGALYTTAVGMDLGAAGNATRTTLFGNIYSGFDLAVIAPIVLAAVALVAIVAYLR